MKIKCILPLLLMLVLFGAAGCRDEPDEDPSTMSFSEIQDAARNTTVRFYMWGGDLKINAWIDGFVTERVKEKYDIRLERVAMDAPVFVTRLLNEKLAGKTDGEMDLLWINGENFKRAKEAGLLYGPIADKLPAFEYCPEDEVDSDFGYPTQGYEAPYGKAQFVFEYDSAKVGNPPETPEELLAWAENNPGMFTYPQPPDFTGSAFIRQLFYLLTGGYEQYMDGFNESLYEEKAPLLWEYLNRIKPFLWQEGRTYPREKSQLDFLFERGEVLFNMSYHQAAASGKILDGRYPETVRTSVFKNGSISNIHFTAVPFNSRNKTGAITVANFLLSPEAQYSKNLPENWGDFTVLSLEKLPEEFREKFIHLDLGRATLPISVLNKNSVPEIPIEYLEQLEKDWEINVLH
jgi:putative spermidine/putrescine transport system substrate-binding protein